MGKRCRLGSSVVGVMALLAVGAACEPPPVPPSFVVTSTADLPDALPGDGLCAAAEGACTLRAAVEEGNAQGSADVVTPSGTYELTDPLVVSGTVRVNIDGPADIGVGTSTTEADITVAPGGHLALDDATVWGHTQVEGTLVARRSSLLRMDVEALTVAAGGIAVIQSSLVQSAFADVTLRNSGTLALDWSQVGGLFAFRFSHIDLGSLATHPGGETRARATWLASGCSAGTVTSFGHVADAGTACALTGADDVNEAPPTVPFGTDHVETPAALIDAVPTGVHGCGDPIVEGVDGQPRPVDGDGDGVAACDIGALDRPTPLP